MHVTAGTRVGVRAPSFRRLARVRFLARLDGGDTARDWGVQVESDGTSLIRLYCSSSQEEAVSETKNGIIVPSFLAHEHFMVASIVLVVVVVYVCMCVCVCFVRRKTV